MLQLTGTVAEMGSPVPPEATEFPELPEALATPGSPVAHKMTAVTGALIGKVSQEAQE